MLRNANLNLKESELNQDHIFRYKLDLECGKTPVFHNRLAELVRTVMESLLNIVMPLKMGKDVKIDGFRWLMDREQIYPLFSQTDSHLYYSNSSHIVRQTDTKRDEQNDYQNIASAAFYEPRIELIKKLIESILTLIEFEYNGKSVKVDGFRLKDLNDWLVTTTGEPSEILDQAASRCDCDCVFCCNKGNPPLICVSNSPHSRSPEKEFDEIRTRIRYFAPEAKKTLFPNLSCAYETMTHPYFLDMLRLLRDRTSRPLRITSNGCQLTHAMVDELTRLKPIYLYLSLNSSSPSRRMNLMKDLNPEVAINALPLLRQHSIPYATVIVPWPFETIDEMLDDLSSTVAYAAKHETHLVQINLPGYSRHFSPTQLFDLRQVWEAVISRVRELRRKYDCPIVAMPTMYEENLYHQRKNMPYIIGVVKNSPAYLCSIEKGDIIKQINGIPVNSRPQARDLLALVKQSGAKEVSLHLQRDKHTLQVILNLTEHAYPYSEDIDAYFGIVFMGSGLRTSYIENLKHLAQAHGAKHVLFLSSELVRPTFEQCLTESHLFGNGGLKIDVEVPKNNFFGGNILLGDLLVVQDFIDHIRDYMNRKNDKPDLVVIPSSPFHLSGWGRDLTGRVYLDIERATGIPVELLPCATIYD